MSVWRVRAVHTLAQDTAAVHHPAPSAASLARARCCTKPRSTRPPCPSPPRRSFNVHRTYGVGSPRPELDNATFAEVQEVRPSSAIFHLAVQPDVAPQGAVQNAVALRAGSQPPAGCGASRTRASLHARAAAGMEPFHATHPPPRTQPHSSPSASWRRAGWSPTCHITRSTSYSHCRPL